MAAGPFTRLSRLHIERADVNATKQDNPSGEDIPYKSGGTPGVSLITGGIILGIVVVLLLLGRIYHRNMAASEIRAQAGSQTPQQLRNPVAASGVLQRIPRTMLGEWTGFGFKSAAQSVARWFGTTTTPSIPRYVQRQGRAPSIASTRSTQPLIDSFLQSGRSPIPVNNSPGSALSETIHLEYVSTPSAVYVGGHSRGESSHQNISL